MKHWVKGGHDYYYNLSTKEGTWVEPQGFVQNNTQLNKDDIQVGSPGRRCPHGPEGCDAFRVQTQKRHIQPFLFPLLSRWFPG